MEYEVNLFPFKTLNNITWIITLKKQGSINFLSCDELCHTLNIRIDEYINKMLKEFNAYLNQDMMICFKSQGEGEIAKYWIESLLIMNKLSQ